MRTSEPDFLTDWRGKTDICVVAVTKDWAVLEMSPKDYGRLVGRSEHDIRACYLKKATNPDAKLRIRIATSELLEGVHDIQESPILKESFGLKPWLSSRERASKRNATIRSRERYSDEDAPAMRKESLSRNRWVRLMRKRTHKEKAWVRTPRLVWD